MHDNIMHLSTGFNGVVIKKIQINEKKEKEKKREVPLSHFNIKKGWIVQNGLEVSLSCFLLSSVSLILISFSFHRWCGIS